MATATAPRQPGIPTAEARATGSVGDIGELSILTAKELIWYIDLNTGLWYAEYGLPNSDRVLLFEARPDQMDALFGVGMRPSSFSKASFKQLTGRGRATFGGNISEVEGKGSFESEVQKVIELAMDEGKLPDWVDENEALDILYISQSEGKSSDWVLDQLAKLPSFKERFPSINKFMTENNLTLAEGIQGFLEFEAGVNQALQAYGKGVHNADPALIGKLLDKGISVKTVTETVGKFRRMEKFQPALTAFNEVLAANGMATISTIQEMLDFVSGSFPSEVYDLYEASSIQEAAVGAGLGNIFSAADAINLGNATDQTLESATEGFQKAAELLLRMRHEVSAGKYGLDHEELIDISLGMTPRSGRSEAEIMENINRAVLAAQENMRQRASSYKSFSGTGTPQAASLGNLRQES